MRPHLPSSPLGVALCVGLVVVLVVALHQVTVAARAFWVEWRDFTPRHWTVPAPEDAASLRLTDVEFHSRDGTALHGWITPSDNHAAVILCTGSGSDRSTMLADARPLIRAGFAVLLFDWPGRGESDGVVQYGASERDALVGALDFVSRQTGVNSSRIGAVGMSSGAYILTQVAAQDQRLRAVALLGAMDAAIPQARAEYRRGGFLAQWAAVAAMRARGMPLRESQPVDVIGHIAPRPVLIVSGAQDGTVPPVLSRRLYDAAGVPKEFWLVPNAGHGNYQVDPSFDTRLRDFFEQALRPDPVASPPGVTP